MTKSEVDKLSLELVRKSLAIISLGDAGEEKEESESEWREYCTAIAAVWPRLEKDIKKFLHEQLVKTSLQSEIWEQVLVGRGVYAVMEILLEHWRKANAEHFNQVKPEEGFDKSSVIGEL